MDKNWLKFLNKGNLILNSDCIGHLELISRHPFNR